MNARLSGRPDCVVVGAGLIGLCVTLRLAETGSRVGLVDMAAPLHGTSGTTGALVTANEKRPLAYFQLGRSSMDEMRSFADELGGRDWFLDTGHLEWGGTPEADAALEARLTELEPWSYPFTRLAPSEVMRELEPDLRIPEHVSSVVFFQEDAIVHPHLMAAAILRRLSELSVRMHFATGPVRLRADGRGIEFGDGQRLEAPSVCVCAGRWTQEVLTGVGYDLPMLKPWGRTPEALGFQVITTPVPVLVQRMVRMPGLSIRPTGAGRLMLHGRPEEAQLHKEGPRPEWCWDRPLVPQPPQAAALVDKARGVLAASDLLTAQSAAASIRAITFDGLPVAGFVPGKPGVYTIVTHSGIGLAPLLGRLAAQEICGKDAEQLQAFRPDRFQTDGWRTRPSPMRDTHLADAPTN